MISRQYCGTHSGILYNTVEGLSTNFGCWKRFKVHNTEAKLKITRHVDMI